jgi:hypothetical protein
LAGLAHVASISVSDTAANVAANLDALQSLAAAGKLSSVALSGQGTQTLDITATQAHADAWALADIKTPFVVHISGAAQGLSASIVTPQPAAVSNFIMAASTLGASAPVSPSFNPPASPVSIFGSLSAHPLA